MSAQTLEPDWLIALRTACEDKTQKEIAAKLGVSPAQVNQVLKGKYRGSLENIEQRVRGVLMAVTRNCPVMGEIGANVCISIQRPPGRALANSLRATIFSQYCPTCVHRVAKGGEK